MTGDVFDAHDDDFEHSVIEKSRSVPVVVDFWAPWCGPCKALGPLLERLTHESQGAFLLAKVNVDENPALSQAFRVQSIPLVLGIRDGQVVAEFAGALPEPSVREFLKRLMPSEAEVLARESSALLADGRREEAREGYDRALGLDARCAEALIGRAGFLADDGNLEEALRALDRVPDGPLRARAERLAAELRVRSVGAGDEAALRERVRGNPADLDARFALAQMLAAHGRFAEALGEYLEIVARDRDYADEAPRKAMLDIFGILGAGDETAERYRSELAKVLFR